MPVMPVSTLRGTWSRLLSAERLRRSSQVLSVIGSSVCIFGGEVVPRQPVDNQVDVFSLSSSSGARLETRTAENAPTPRVGSASTALHGHMYLFSGRGGVDMAPLEEDGALWRYNASDLQWSRVEPADSSKPYPPARSYHCTANDGQNTIFIHAGCPAKGRLSDLWKFDLADRTWTQLADAPGPQRGGASIAFNGGKLFRMNGFDGTKEQGGAIDIFDVAANSWSTETFNADGNGGPAPRSVCTLLPVHLQRKDKLLTLFGEHDPSSLGHAGAGKMLSDVWIYDISENWWTKLEPNPSEADGVPAPRGWFDADVIQSQTGNDGIIVHGGLGEDNERLTDAWVLKF